MDEDLHSHVGSGEEADAECQGPGGLRKGLDSVHKGVEAPCDGESSEERRGEAQSGVGHDVEEWDEQECGDVLQIVQMSPILFKLY